MEEFAKGIAGVDQVAACPVETQWGQSVGIVYSGSPEASFDSLVEGLSVAAKPAKVVRIDELPALVSGKPDLVACSALLAD